MELLTKLTPAEAYLIIKNKKSNYKDLLKLTIADLLLKKVIKVEKRNTDDDQEDKFMSTGIRFDSYQAKEHEKLILAPWYNASDLEIHFRDFIKTCIQNGKNLMHFGVQNTIKANGLYDNYKQGFWNKLFATLSLNESGVELKAKIEEELSVVQRKITAYMQEDRSKAIEIISIIHGNIYLVEGLDPEILKEIEEALNQLSGATDEYTYDTYWMWYGDDYDNDISNSYFDDAFDSSDSSDGGDGGDSGCSGCGGCGGD